MCKNRLTISSMNSSVDMYSLQRTLECICADARQETLGAAGQGRKE